MGIAKNEVMNRKKLWPWFLTIVVLIIIDWVSKLCVYFSISVMEGVPVSSFFDLKLAYNRGMAFGMLRDHSGWQVLVLTLLALGVTGVLIRWLYRAREEGTYLKLGLSFIIAGALGNALDRVWHGFVVDFLDFHMLGWHFWTFNGADIFITIGVIALLIDCLLSKRKSPV